jgi:hypothetical protein
MLLKGNLRMLGLGMGVIATMVRPSLSSRSDSLIIVPERPELQIQYRDGCGYVQVVVVVGELVTS